MPLPKNIILVLGAGVSRPYGFPLGADLVQQIIGVNAKNFVAQTRPDKFSESLVKKFQEDLRNSGRRSIDRFLQQQPEHADLGKTLIAYSLTNNEDPDEVYAGETRGGIYSYFYNNILDPNSPKELNSNRFVVITYNYDRSLEFFLWNALRHGFSLSNDEAAQHLKSLPIYHVHGSFGDITGDHAREYARNFDDVNKAPERLRIVSEDIEQSSVIHECRKEISLSRDIIFLGFAYDRANVQRLLIPEIMAEREENGDGEASNIYGTTKGLVPAEVSHNVVPLFAQLAPNLSDADCLAYLRDLTGLWA